MYILPATRSATCDGVIAKLCVGMDPLVATGTPENGNVTGPFTPGGAVWICDAVAAAVKPDHDSSTVICVCAALRTTVPNPIPGLALAGTSLRPVRLQSNVIWTQL